MDRTLPDPTSAVAGIADGVTVMMGGFGGSGAPIELIHALVERHAATGHPKDLTVVNTNAGNGRVGLAALIAAGMGTKVICSFPCVAGPVVFTERDLADQIELELVPQGTPADPVRAGGAEIPAFCAPTGYGTELARDKPVAVLDGRPSIDERWLRGDHALVKAHPGDRPGNLTCRMAAAGTIVQASRIVAPGKIDPETVIPPGIFVRGLVAVPNPAGEEDVNRAGVRYGKVVA